MKTKKWSWLVFVVLLLGLVIPILAQAEPAISTDQSVYPPNATVTVSGTGFEPNTKVALVFHKPGGGGDKYFIDTSNDGTLSYLWGDTDEVGQYVVEANTSGGHPLAKCEFTVTVGNVPPTLTCPGDQEVDEGTGLSGLSGSFDDPDEDKWEGGVDWGEGAGFVDEIKIDPIKKTFVLPNHTYANNGEYTATVRIKDGESGGDCTFTVTVNNVPPKLTCPGDQKVNEGTALSGLSGSFTDPGADKWEGGVDWGDGNWDEIKIDPDKKLFFLPDHAYADQGVYKVTVAIKDGYDGGACTFTVTVNNVPPKLTCPGDQKVDEGTALSGLSGSFTDPGADKWYGGVDWGEGAGFVDEIKIDPIEKTFTLPNHTYADNGEYTATVRIKDGEGGGDCTFTVTVNNVDPTITAVTNDGPVDEASPVTVTVTASDVAGTNDPLSYEFDFDNDGTYEVGPQVSNQASHTYMDNGSYLVNVRVTDGDGGSTTGSTTVTVNNVSPTLAAIENHSMNEAETLTVSLEAHDPGADTLLYFYITNPHNSFTTLTDNGNGTGEFVFTPGYTDAGTYFVTVTVTDDDHGTTSATFTLAVNDPITPVSTHTIDPAPNAAGWNKTDPVAVNITATDDGGSGTVASIHYILHGGSEVTVAGSSASVSVSGEGTHTVEYWAVDDAGNVETPHNTATVKIDTIAPIVAVTSGPFPAWPPDFVSSLTSGSGQISDPGGSGVDEDSCEYKIDSSGWVSWSIPGGAISTNLGTVLAGAGVSGDGQHMLYGRVKDIAGNEFVGGGSFKLDDTPPIDPSVISTSHTIDVWSKENTIDFEWSGATDGNGSGVAAYSFLVDTSPSSEPDMTVDMMHGTDPHTWTSPPLSDGDSYYFHLRTVDHLGNWSGTVHLGPFKIDTENPVITCPGNITQVNDTGVCGATIDPGTATATDNCSATVAGVRSDGLALNALYPVGTTTITWTATDPAGNTDSCVQTIVVNDTEDPVISGCPSDITADNDPGICGAVVTWTAPTASANCGIDTFTADHHPGDTFPIGTTTVTYTATDIHENSVTCSFNVTVNDSEDPTITCPSDVNQTADPGVCQAAVTITVPATDDNCGVASVVNDYNNANDASDTYPVGTTTVTYTVTDIHGNSTQCSFDVTITDDEDPTITCPDDVTVNTDAGLCYATNVDLGTPITDDNCGVASVFNDAPTQFPKGDTVVTWTVTDIHGNSSTCTQTVTVLDNEAPTITCPENIVVDNDAGECGAVVTYTVDYNDNCPGAMIEQIAGLASGSQFPVGTTTNTFRVTDASGNTGQCSFDVTVNDSENPVITCPGDITQDNDAGVCGASIDPGTATATDNCSATVAGVRSDGLALNAVYPVGTTTITWTATDPAGNTDSCVQTIVVNDTENPVISGCPSDITADNDPGICGAVVTWTAPTASDNCGIDTFTSDYNSGDTFPVGTTTVTYTATDIHGNVTTCSFDVTVNDAEPPTTMFTSTPPDPDNDATPYFEWTGTDNNTCTAPANLVYSNRLDDGDWSTWSVSTSITLDPLTEGTHTFEVRVKDEAGNIGDPAIYMWLVDLSGPEITITVPEDGAEYGLNDTVSSDWIAVDALSGLDTASASDDVSTEMASGEAFYTGAPGLHSFTVTATDLAGNTTTETVTYRVVYTVLPGGAAGGGGGVEGEGGSFLDKSIAGGGGAVGIAPLEAIYTVGDVIHASFSLTDAEANNIPDAVVSCTLVKVTLGEEEAYDVLNLWRFNYDADTELYSLDIPTEGLAPGTYDLWLGFDDGTQKRLRIQLEKGEG